jgi:hypothetical protein
MKSRWLIEDTGGILSLAFLRYRQTTTRRVSNEPLRRTAQVPAPTVSAATTAGPSPATTSAAGEVSTASEWTRIPRRHRSFVKLAVGILKSKSNSP